MNRLNLGAGFDMRRGWIRIDLDPDTHPDVVADVRRLDAIDSGSIDTIRAIDILEHLSYRDTVPTLREWARVLKHNGRILLQVPAADHMMTQFVRQTTDDLWYDVCDIEGRAPDELQEQPLMVKLAWHLLGGHYDDQHTLDPERWYLNAHHALFDEETIRWAAGQAGLVVKSLKVNAHPNYQAVLAKP